MGYHEEGYDSFRVPS
jgi:hypothetical protein